MARLTFLGATRIVTGSAYLLETERATLLLECGLIQGSRKEELANSEPFPFDIGRLDGVILSHAHLDHSGRLPKLAADGYNGPIYTTEPTRDLLSVLLNDAASLQKRDVEWENKRRKRAGKLELEPLYTDEDVEQALSLCRGYDYGVRFEAAPGVEVRFREAGHILGSAIVEIHIREAGRERKLVFTGDLGNSDAALLRDPETISSADILLQESTYGDRDHRSFHETLEEFEEIIVEASKSGGNILIPAFAVGRTQELIFHLGELYQKGLLRQQAVYLDSPMAIATTEIYHRHQNLFNKEDSATMRHANSGSLHRFLPVLRYSRTTEESMRLNRIEGGAIIIAGSGMCNGGRIRHHLKHNLWRRDAHVVIVGFQAMGTPGRALVDGAKTYRMAGEEITVKAKIHTLGGFSAHAGQSQLLRWVSGFTGQQPHIYLVHGDPEAKEQMQHRLKALNHRVEIPVQNSGISF